MKAIRHRVQGKLWQENGRSALLLLDPFPTKEAAHLLYLRYALVTMGREEHIFPALLVDDWGAEIRGLKVYRWVGEHGNKFPRATVFGFEADGTDTQVFLRELELYVTLPVYAYPSRDTDLTAGVRLDAILLPDKGTATPERVKRPSAYERPLRSARVQWWQVPYSLDAFDFSLLTEKS